MRCGMCKKAATLALRNKIAVTLAARRLFSGRFFPMCVCLAGRAASGMFTRAMAERPAPLWCCAECSQRSGHAHHPKAAMGLCRYGSMRASGPLAPLAGMATQDVVRPSATVRQKRDENYAGPAIPLW